MVASCECVAQSARVVSRVTSVVADLRIKMSWTITSSSFVSSQRLFTISTQGVTACIVLGCVIYVA